MATRVLASRTIVRHSPTLCLATTVVRYLRCQPTVNGAVLVNGCRLLHSTRLSLASENRQVDNKGSSSPGNEDSVLMQVFKKKEQSKQLTVGAKVVRASRDFSYLIAIIGGFGLTGFLFYSVGSEFFSSNSPSSIFTQALKRVRADDQIKQILGEPITGHGEESGRGRRRHLNHLEYEAEGRSHMRMAFHVSGSKRKGKAHLDLVKNEAGKFELRFLFVELVGYPPATIMIVDNR